MNEELIKENAELNAKVSMYERMINLLESQLQNLQHNLDNSNSNLKLSIQTPTVSHSRQNISMNEQSVSKILIHTFKANLQDIKDEKIQSLLEIDSPAHSSLIFIIERGLRGAHTNGEQLIHLSTNRFCKYMNEAGEMTMDTLTTTFDIIADLVYERCSTIVSSLSAKLEDGEYNEDEHFYDNNRYSNLMMLKDSKQKAKLIREITPLLK